jgi:hypothetical protein
VLKTSTYVSEQPEKGQVSRKIPAFFTPFVLPLHTSFSSPSSRKKKNPKKERIRGKQKRKL